MRAAEVLAVYADRARKMQGCGPDLLVLRPGGRSRSFVGQARIPGSHLNSVRKPERPWPLMPKLLSAPDWV